jgi:hypothetical protein
MENRRREKFLEGERFVSVDFSETIRNGLMEDRTIEGE